MSGLDRVKEKMKKKLLFAELPMVQEEKGNAARKIYSLSKEDNLRLKKLFSKRLNLENQTSIALIMSEAIELLYFQEFPKQS